MNHINPGDPVRSWYNPGASLCVVPTIGPYCCETTGYQTGTRIIDALGFDAFSGAQYAHKGGLGDLAKQYLEGRGWMVQTN